VLPKDSDLHRIAGRLVKTLIDGQLVAPKEAPAALEKRVFEALRKNREDEAALDREAEKVFEANQKQMAGMDQRQLLRKIKEKLARERGFVL
jgi:hypothetical protein